MDLDLPLIWALLLATAVFLYVVMDGFDLGVGILFPTLRSREERDVAVNSIAPVWDGNETWLVLGGGGLLAVFPLAYAVVLPALYMPLIVMLLALVFRGVAFEMRFRAASEGARLSWDRGFWLGSTVAGFSQGVALGAYVQGIEVSGRAYAGGWWDWLSPFSVLTGFALVAGYGLLGATWLVWKTEGALHELARREARRFAIAMLAFIAAVSLAMPLLQPAFAARWFGFPTLLVAWIVPVAVGVLAVLLFRALAAATPEGERDLHALARCRGPSARRCCCSCSAMRGSASACGRTSCRPASASGTPPPRRRPGLPAGGRRGAVPVIWSTPPSSTGSSAQGAGGEGYHH
jgi:cytochrome d ubiquinol oxidase subunit II